MIKDDIKKLLNIKDEQLQKLDIEQLRILLGSTRYLTRQVEREINRRFTENPFGITLKS